jgi:hypothetical protein
MRTCQVLDNFVRFQLDQRHRLTVVSRDVVHLSTNGHGRVIAVVLRLIETVDVFLVQILLFYLLHILWTQQTRYIVQDITLIISLATCSGLALPQWCTISGRIINTRTISKSITSHIVPTHVSCLQNILEPCRDGPLLNKLF